MVKSVNNQAASKQVALLGGTFDPFHNGHLRMAIELRLAGFDQVLIIPNAVPPHRPQPGASAEQRLAMIHQVIDDIDGIDVDDCELARGGDSYSVLTLEEKRQQLGDAAGLTWVMGDDAFAGLHKWHQRERIAELANVLVVSRGQENQFESGSLQADWLQQGSTELQTLLKCTYGRLCRMDWPVLDISATRVRALLAADVPERMTRAQLLQGLVPDAVANFIHTNSLYR